MSNSVTIEPTVFTSVQSGNVTHGYRAYDGYAQTYCNTWTDIPHDDFDILADAMEGADDILTDMLESVQNNETGIYIGATFYDWDEIKHLF